MTNLDTLIQRQSSLESLLPSSNQDVQELIRQSRVELEFIAQFHKTKGWSDFHAPFVMQTVSCLRALENGTSLSKARGDGRMATLLDVTRSNGSGLGRSLRSIERFNGLPESDRIVGPGNVTYPKLDLLPRSKQVLNDLVKLIKKREAALPHKKFLNKQEREALLLNSKMSNDSIIAHTIEYLARAFALQVEPEIRHNLITGAGPTSLKAAFDKLQLAPA